MSDTLPRLNAALDGRYRIERVAGQGGMATVYLAHDHKHDRPVALKVLRPDLAAVMGADRFLSEIKTTANLQHPHILPLHDSGDADGFLFYVMPYVEGESLRSLIDREKQLGVDEALRITKAVGNALDYAHRQGVIHRDIKPENVLMHDGQPLVADFGIALAVTAAGAGRLTETGLSLGTPYYMSPEQATADRDPGPQSDVYSLACMLYEMLVGDPPHTGSSAQAVLAKILTERPRSVTELRQTVPPHVGAAVAKALERLPADRFDTADAFVKALDDASFTHLTVAKTAAMLAAPSSPGATRRGRVISALPWTVAAVATSVAMWALGSEPAAAPVTRVYLTTPEGQGYSEAGRNPAANALAISPDGSQLVYAGPGDASTAGRGQLWRRPLNALEAVPITGTEQGTAPRFSNDGRQLAFMSDGRIGVMLAEGGTPVWLQNGSPAFAWGDDDAIYFTAVGELRRWVPGEAESTSLGEVGAGGVYDVLPGSAAYLIGAPEGMAVFDAATGESHTLGAGRRPRYLDTGHIVFARLADGVLLVQPFDVRTLATTGPAVSTSAAVRTGGVGSDFGLAADGTLVYAVGGEGSGERLAWVDRSGATEVIDWIEPASFDGIDLSPSGNRVAAGWSGGVSGRGSTDIWVFDLTERSQNRLTTDGQSIRPQWHPIEPRIAFVHDGSPERSISSIAADGSGAAELVVAITDGGPADAWWTQDGRELLLRIQGASLRSIFRFVPGEDEVPQPWLDREFNERNPAPSPDGNWLVYSSDQSGRDEVYAQPYPGRGAVQNVSIDGGSQAVWSRDGREIFFVGTDGFMWSATVSYDTSSFRVESRQRLFELNEDLGADIQRPNWDVAPDGRFLMTRGDTERGASALVLVRNWVQEITGRR